MGHYGATYLITTQWKTYINTYTHINTPPQHTHTHTHTHTHWHAEFSRLWICAEMSSRWIGGNERVVELILSPSSPPSFLHLLLLLLLLLLPPFLRGSGVQHMAPLPRFSALFSRWLQLSRKVRVPLSPVCTFFTRKLFFFFPTSRLDSLRLGEHAPARQRPAARPRSPLVVAWKGAPTLVKETKPASLSCFLLCASAFTQDPGNNDET